MNPKSVTEFGRYTPEELSELYKKDPDRFEEIARDALSQACLGGTPEQNVRRRQLQWTIEAQLRKGKTPLDRMHIMENIFYGQVFGAEGELAQLMDSCAALLRVARGTEPVPKQRPALYLAKR
jgi:hypothetical protein